MTSAHRTGVVTLAVVLALAGCSDTPADDEPVPSSTGTAPSAPSPGGQPDPASSGPPQGSDGSQLAPDELVAVLTAIDEAESLNARVIPDDELRTLEEEGAQRAQDITVTPEECNAYAESALESVSEGSSRGAMTFAGESSLQPDTISLSSFASAEAAGEQVQFTREQLENCSEFTMDISNESIRTTVAEVAVDTEAEETLALRTTAQVPGTIQQSITIRALVGSTVVDVLVGSSTDPEVDVARAEQLTDLIVAELRAR